MGFKLTEAVYRLPKDATSPTEQAVLVALAFRANDQTERCFPTQGTLEEMTHLSRSAIANALNALRENGLLAWESGEFANKRGKYGQALANSYRFTLPGCEAPAKTEQCPPAGQGSVLQQDTTVSSRKTLQCPPGRHQQNSNILYNTDTEQKSSPPPSSVIDMFADDYRGRSAKEGVVSYALRVLGIDRNDPTYKANYNSIGSALMKLGGEDYAVDFIDQVNSEIRQGEWDAVRNRPAVFINRINALAS